MIEHHNNIELFDLYLNNGLSHDEGVKFDEKLLNDTSFNEAFILYKTMTLGIKDYGKAELKNYIKQNAGTQNGDNRLKVMRTLYAVAASVVLIVGLVFVFQQFGNTSNNKKMEIAATPEPVIVPADTISRPNLTFMELEEAKKEEVQPMDMAKVESDNIAAPPIASNDDLDSKDIYTFEGAGASAPSVDTEGYKIVSEKKLSDTILYAFYLDIVSLDDVKIESKKSKENFSKKSLPGVYNNKNNNKKTQTDSEDDTTSFKKLKNGAVKKDQYTIEYWQSPINFKGYKLVNSTLQLYGLGETATVRLFKIEFQLYLRMNGAVYQLKNCPDGCGFSILQDEDMRQLILDQK